LHQTLFCESNFAQFIKASVSNSHQGGAMRFFVQFKDIYDYEAEDTYALKAYLNKKFAVNEQIDFTFKDHIKKIEGTVNFVADASFQVMVHGREFKMTQNGIEFASGEADQLVFISSPRGT